MFSGYPACFDENDQGICPVIYAKKPPQQAAFYILYRQFQLVKNNTR